MVPADLSVCLPQVVPAAVLESPSELVECHPEREAVAAESTVEQADSFPPLREHPGCEPIVQPTVVHESGGGDDDLTICRHFFMTTTVMTTRRTKLLRPSLRRPRKRNLWWSVSITLVDAG